MDRESAVNSLSQLQEHKIDPVAIEPDVACLARFVSHCIPKDNTHPLYVVLGEKFGYMLALGEAKNTWQCRTFLIGASQNRTSVLLSQIPLTLASLNLARPDSILVYDSQMHTDLGKLGMSSTCPVRQFDLEHIVAGISLGVDRSEVIDFVITYGSALGYLESHHVDFRHDFSPYQGRKMLMEKGMQYLSIGATAMLLAIGLFLQLHVYKTNKYAEESKAKFQKEFETIVIHRTFGQDPVAARRLAASSLRTLLPKDVGLLLSGKHLLLDFSTRPFDTIEFEFDNPTIVIPRTQLTQADLLISKAYGITQLVHLGP
jgi:hypothetical protein